MPAFNSTGLLLRRFAYGESSLVLQALTGERGRVHLIAKGAYRPKSRFYAALDLFDTLELGWTRAPGQELGNLQTATIVRRRQDVPLDLEGYRAALTVLELAGLAAREDQSSRSLLALCEQALDLLHAGGLAPAAVLAAFELGFLRELGIEPALELCAACGGEAAPVEGAGPRARAAFSAGAGGRLCRACAEEARASGRRVGTLPAAVLEHAAALLESGAGSVSGDAALERVRDCTARFLEYHLEGRPRSYARFLAVPNRNRPGA